MADRSGFDEFVATRSPALLRTAYLLTGDHGLAEDLLQTALAKCWFAWGRIDGPPEPYVRRALATTYATWWRRRWRGERPTGELPDRGDPAATTSVDDRDALWRALGALPRRQRAVVVLRYYEDLSEAETASALGISTGTVKSQAAKALSALRRDADLQRAIGGAQ
jgi:RNA polymerase sigma-70 factor (sigma-E family)